MLLVQALFSVTLLGRSEMLALRTPVLSLMRRVILEDCCYHV